MCSRLLIRCCYLIKQRDPSDRPQPTRIYTPTAWLANLHSGVAGGLIISAWGGLKKRRVYGVIDPLIITGIAQIVLGLAPWIYLAAVGIGILDGTIPLRYFIFQPWRGHTVPTE